MMAFNLKIRLWNEVLTHNLDIVCDTKIVDCDGKPYLVTRVWKAGFIKSINIWDLKCNIKLITHLYHFDTIEEWKKVLQAYSTNRTL